MHPPIRRTYAFLTPMRISMYRLYGILSRNNCIVGRIAAKRVGAYLSQVSPQSQLNQTHGTQRAKLYQARVEQSMMSLANSTVPDAAVGQACWYAVRTRPRHEKKVASELQEKGVKIYLPLVTQVRRWSDRRKVIQVPLFSCYAFVHSVLDLHLRLAIYGISGALGFVGPNNQGVSIPDIQIENIRSLMASNVSLTPYQLLKAGQRVRVRGGALDGLEGILVTHGERRLVVSVEGVHASFSINLDGYDVEPV